MCLFRRLEHAMYMGKADVILPDLCPCLCLSRCPSRLSAHTTAVLRPLTSSRPRARSSPLHPYHVATMLAWLDKYAVVRSSENLPKSAVAVNTIHTYVPLSRASYHPLSTSCALYRIAFPTERFSLNHRVWYTHRRERQIVNPHC